MIETVPADLVHTSPVFDFEQGEFVTLNGKVKTAVGSESVITWTQKVIRTELNRYGIYKGTGFGVRLEEYLVGHIFPKDYIRAEIGNSIKTALLKHDGIRDVRIDDLKIDGSKLTWDITEFLTSGAMLSVRGEL